MANMTTTVLPNIMADMTATVLLNIQQHQDPTNTEQVQMQITVKTTEQLKTDFPRIIFDNVSTITVDQHTPQNTNFITQMETARDGKTYVLTDLDVQLPNKSQCDQIRAKLDMGAETKHSTPQNI